MEFWKRDRNVHKLDIAGVDDAVKSIAVSPDGKWLAMAEATGKVKLFAMPSAKLTKTLDGHAGGANGVAFSSDSISISSP